MNRDPYLTRVVHRAAVRAMLAPSVHNTQPWRFHLAPSGLEIFADRARRLRYLDPLGRQMFISCGAALFNARVSVSATGYTPVVQRMPDPDSPGLLARVLVGAPSDYLPLAVLDEYIPRRRTNRRAYAHEPVPASVLETLRSAATAEKADLVVIDEDEHRMLTATLAQRADHAENANAAYRTELASWSTDDPTRRDGVQAATVPYLPHEARESGDAVPIRAFDTNAMGWLPSSSGSDTEQCLVLLTSAKDEPADWLRIGEALQRIWLELTRAGYWASPLTQVVEVGESNRALRNALGISGHPEVLLRIGKAPEVTSSNRRRLDEVLVDERARTTAAAEAIL